MQTKEYTKVELTEKIEKRLQELDATKSEEELEDLATVCAVLMANTVLDDGEYSYNKETDTVILTIKE